MSWAFPGSESSLVKDMSMKVCISLCTRNRPRMLAQCLASLVPAIAAAPEAEVFVIVVENGASKSRKTFFKSMLIAGYIGGNSDNFAPSFKGHGTKDKYVLEFDTEQSRFHAKLCMDRVNEMVGSEYELYKTFALRQYNPNERLQFIDWIVNESEYRGKIGLISIDGYVDLVTDFNSLEQATNLSEKLMQWTSVGNLHCTGILHKNFGTSKPVGHVGSSVLKKAETVVFVEKDNDLTIVKCEYSRNIPFKTVAFKVNENWLPTEIDNYSEESYPVSKNSAFK